MKFSIACTTALAGFALAQNDVQSKPFKLQLSSDDKSLDGKFLNSCHSGAAINSLCLYADGTQFKFNTTKGAAAEVKGLTPTGKLTWDLPSGDLTFNLPMSFSIDASTNVAMPLFTPSDSNIQYVAFDTKTEALRIISYLDDTKKPVQVGKSTVLNRWYLCSTNYAGYQYKTLNWVLGNDKPQNPSCKKVDVKRKF